MDFESGGYPTVLVTGDTEAVDGNLPLRDENVDVLTATSDEAPSVVEETMVDCVVSGSDLSLVERLGAPELPFVLVSDGSTTPSEAADSGVADYVETPTREGEDRIAARRVVGHAQRYRSERAETRCRSIIRHMPDHVILHDKDGEVVGANRRTSEQLGYTVDELLGANVSEFEVGIDRDELKELRGEYEYGEPIIVEGRHRRKDGTEFPVEVNVGKTEIGDTELFLAIARDITERKERERRIRRSRELLSHTERLADAGGWELDARTDELRWTDGTREIYGVSPDYEPTLDEAIGLFHTEDRDVIAQAVENCRENAEPYDVELRIITADDEVRWVRATGEAVVEDGEVVKLRGAIRDITDRWERQKQLEKAQEIAKIGLWTKDIPSDVIDWSDEVYDLWGVDRDAGPIDHTTFLEHVHPDDEGFVEEEWEAAKDGEPYDIEHRIVTGDGEVRWMREKAELTFDEDGEPVSATGIVQDITERKEREERLRKRKEVLEEREDQLRFFNDVLAEKVLLSMTLVRGNSEAVLERLPDDAEVRSEVERINSRSNRITDIVNRVNSTIAAVVGDEDAELSAQNLSDTVNNRVRYVDVTRDVEITTEVPEGVEVTADEFLDEVVETLLTNAVQHNDKDEPRVEVTVEEDDETVTLRVADNGPGVPDGMKEAVFEPGVKGDDSDGVGFGLYFVDAMVDEYGGDVRVEDSQPEGAVFVVELPRAT